MTERARDIQKRAENATDEAMRAIHETGELRHLHGKPLDLSDTSPDWLVNRVLKEQGFSHPLIERGKEIAAAESQVEGALEPLRRRRRWLERPGAHATLEQINAFNQRRERVLREYRSGLEKLNRDLRDYNLTVPDALHRRLYPVDDMVSRAAAEVPPLPVPARPTPERKPSARRRLFKRT
jgi:hypothetical protein